MNVSVERNLFHDLIGYIKLNQPIIAHIIVIEKMVEIMEKIDIQNSCEIKFCKRCHRRLKNEEAKKLGYGKICYEKSKREHANYLFRIEGDNICLNS